MTPRTNARIAGVVFLAYIVVGLTQMGLMGRVTAGAAGTAETLARYVEHAGLVRVSALLSLLQGFSAIVLGVTLYSLTRAVDRDLALLAFALRLVEGVNGTRGAVTLLALLRVTPEAGEALLKPGSPGTLVSATCFAVGSTLFAWLFLRAGSIPRWMAQLGVVASLLLVVLLPAQILGFQAGTLATVMWLPMLVFEVGLAGWLIVRGVK